MPQSYRKDVDGLRALAVVPVVLFHAGFDIFSGGFVGVDIFFVISGFLITRLILEDISAKSFSILEFYARRIRRIAPALVCVLLASTTLSYYLLLPEELLAYARSLVSASFFYANYHFMFDAGYFTAPAETNPLLHTWSLSVEEQFYIAFPVILYILSNRSPHLLGRALIGFAALSFLYSIWIVSTNSEHAFFSAPARAWELLIGAIVAIYEKGSQTSRIKAEALATSGLIAVTVSIIFFNAETSFPGLSALLPAGGTALIIYAGTTHRTTVAAILSTSPMRLLGQISYPLYLWHWPALVFYRTYSVRTPSPLETALVLIGAVILSFLTFKFIETPIRKRRIFPDRRQVLITGISVIAVGAMCGAFLIVRDGLPSRFPSSVNAIAEASEDVQSTLPTLKLETSTGFRFSATPIGATNSAKPTFLVWGDSHGESLLPGIASSATASGEKGLFVGRGGCLPLLDAHQVRKGYERCPMLANGVIEYLEENSEIQTVVLISRWSIYAMGERFKGEAGHTVFIRDAKTSDLSLEENKAVFTRSLDKTLSKLQSMRKRIVIVTQTPETEWHIPTALARAKWLGHEIDFKPSFPEYQSRNLFVNALFERNAEPFGITILRSDIYMCDKEKCKVEENGVPIYRDTNHITRSQAEHLKNMFNQIFR